MIEDIVKMEKVAKNMRSYLSWRLVERLKEIIDRNGDMIKEALWAREMEKAARKIDLDDADHFRQYADYLETGIHVFPADIIWFLGISERFGL